MQSPKIQWQSRPRTEEIRIWMSKAIRAEPEHLEWVSKAMFRLCDDVGIVLISHVKRDNETTL